MKKFSTILALVLVIAFAGAPASFGLMATTVGEEENCPEDFTDAEPIAADPWNLDVEPTANAEQNTATFD